MMNPFTFNIVVWLVMRIEVLLRAGNCDGSHAPTAARDEMPTQQAVAEEWRSNFPSTVWWVRHEGAQVDS